MHYIKEVVYCRQLVSVEMRWRKGQDCVPSVVDTKKIDTTWKLKHS